MKPLRCQKKTAERSLEQTAEKAGELKYLQTMRSRNGVVLKEISSEQYAQAKSTVREVEISNRQFDAANGIRLTANGKITTTESKMLVKNLETIQGVELREPRFVTPTTAEFFRKAEIIKGMREVRQIRQELALTSNRAKERNVGFADIEVNGVQSRRVGISGKKEVEGTALIPEKRFFKTGYDPHDMASDSEVKILEEFATKYANQAKEVKGTIYLFTERPPCGSCTDVVKQFREMFPNVKIEVASGSFIEKPKGK